MPSWNELAAEAEQVPAEHAGTWLRAKKTAALGDVARLRGDRNVILYASAFLQKAGAPFDRTALTGEDLNAFMSVMKGMAWERGLTLILHTPGGDPSAAETIVNYLRSKFDYIEVIVPTYAMSAGTMVALAADKIVMGRQSQLGPIDPQMPINGRPVAAQAIVDQFDRAKKEILGDAKAPNHLLDAQRVALAWGPILQSLGPALLEQARLALEYGEEIVAKWLAAYMLKNHATPQQHAESVAHHFNDAGKHKSHGRRIGRDDARKQGLQVEDLEPGQLLQEAVLTAYHLATITFERSTASKLLATNAGTFWVKNWEPPSIPNLRQLR